jgi:septum formation protein
MNRRAASETTQSSTSPSLRLSSQHERINLPRIILASASPRRADLLRELGLKFRVVPSNAPEAHHEQLTARELSQLNAYRKARAIAKQLPDALVLGADTLVYYGTRLFGKPASLDEAERMISQLQGRTHQVVTGVCLIHLRRFRQKIFAETTEVTFRPLDRKQIRNYLKAIQPLDKAGAYAIQVKGDLIVEKVAGSFSNVVGLPVERLKTELQTW